MSKLVLPPGQKLILLQQDRFACTDFSGCECRKMTGKSLETQVYLHCLCFLEYCLQNYLIKFLYSLPHKDTTFSAM